MVSAFVSTSAVTFSVSRTQHLPLYLSSANGDSEKKLTIEKVTDDNMAALLHPPSKRPVLVDAFAPWCGPCKLLDKVLRKAQPRYLDRVDFLRWNVDDKEKTAELKKIFIDSGHKLTKLPSLILFREGVPTVVRPGFANEHQLDFWLEQSLPDVLERTFDDNGIKMDTFTAVPEMVAEVSTRKEELPDENESTASSLNSTIECNDETECFEILEKKVWENRKVVPAFKGISARENAFNP